MCTIDIKMIYEYRDGCVLRCRACVRECGVLEGKDRSGDCRREGRAACVCACVCVCFGATVNGEAIIPPAVLMDARFFRLRHSPEGAGFNLSRNTTSLQEAQPARLGQWRCRRAFGKTKKQKKPKPTSRLSPALTLQWSGNAVPRSKLALISRVCSPNARSIFRLKCSFLSLMCVTSFSS